MTTFGEVWRQVQARLPDAAPREGMLLVGHVTGLDTMALLRTEQAPFPVAHREDLEALLARRAAGEPLGYVLGHAPLWGHDWQVQPGVLIPRPDTETLIAAALEVIPPDAPCHVAEVGVGSGAIIGSLLLERPLMRAVATDISATARQVAAANLTARGVAARCRIVEADVLDGVEGPFDVVVSNPPYIAQAEYDALEPCVRDHEPAAALLAGADGLDLYRRLLAEAAEKVRSEGWLMVEIGCGQAQAVQDLLPATTWKNIFTRNDLAGRLRVVGAQRL